MPGPDLVSKEDIPLGSDEEPRTVYRYRVIDSDSDLTAGLMGLAEGPEPS